MRGFARSIFTVDPTNIKAVLTGQFADYGKGERFHSEWREFLGDSIFATDGELWARSRALIRPMFARERIVDTSMFETHVDKLLDLLSPEANGAKGGGGGGGVGGAVDVGPLFFRLTLDAATDHLLGQPVNSLDDPATTFAEAFGYVLHRQALLFRAGPVSPLLSRKKFRENLRKMDDFMRPFIAHALSLSAEELEKQVSKKETFLHALARFTRDPTVLRDQIVSVLLAGRDTTAATLSFCVFELSRHPDVVQRLRNEMDAHLPGGLAGGQKPTYAHLKEMKYLTAVLNETMRLYPVVPFNVRHSLVDTTLPRGGGHDGNAPIGVPADTRIVYSTMALQRRKDLYPSSPTYSSPPPSSSSSPDEKTNTYGADAFVDPSLFNPSRWLPNEGNWQPRPWHFIPFNGGPRICLGQQFAMLEMGYTITRILQRYPGGIRDANSPVLKPGEDPKFKFDVTLSPGQPLNCVFEK